MKLVMIGVQLQDLNRVSLSEKNVDILRKLEHLLLALKDENPITLTEAYLTAISFENIELGIIRCPTTHKLYPVRIEHENTELKETSVELNREDLERIHILIKVANPAFEPNKAECNDLNIHAFIDRYIDELPKEWRTALDMRIAMKNSMLEALSNPRKFLSPVKNMFDGIKPLEGEELRIMNEFTDRIIEKPKNRK
jgi:hypothetical protein